MVRASVELFLNFNEVVGPEYDLGVRQQGYLWLTTDAGCVERQRSIVEAQHSWGQTDVELLPGDEVRRRFPYVGSNVLQARFRQDDGFLDPKQLTMGLAAASGAQVLVGCGVTGFRIEGGRLTGVETERGLIQTEAVVVAAGPLSGPLAARAGVELPVHTVLRQKVILPVAPEVPPHAPMTIDEDTGAHWRPALQGAYLLFTDPATPASPPTDDVHLEPEFAFRLLDPASPSAVARVAPFWAGVWERGAVNWLLQGGQYTMSPDHRPLIGPTDVEGLWVNTGYSGHGIMGGPAGGRILADLLTGRTQRDANPFRLDRPFIERERDVL